jgi:uncharacterized membrane protein YGL010W
LRRIDDLFARYGEAHRNPANKAIHWVCVPLMVYPLTQLQSNVLAVAAVVFVLAWIGQFVGHLIEGRKPSFFEDIKFLLIGPAWLLGFIYRRAGIPY